MLSEGKRSGYEIKKLLSEGEMFFWKESYGNIYPILRKLTEDNLVRPIDANIKKKRRIYYELTDAGRKELLEWLKTPPVLGRFRVELLMKLRFCEAAGIGVMKSHIDHYRKINTEEIKECEDIIGELNNNGGSLTDEARRMTLTYMLSFKRAIIEWCGESIKRLDEWERDDRE
jgi:DNA-binding PadR family transcriptional regulator